MAIYSNFGEPLALQEAKAFIMGYIDLCLLSELPTV